jgi:hypothetical protein
MLSSGREINPYQQATAAANAMKEWLWVHQRFFLDGPDERPEESFKVWPDLLILGPGGVSPILPLRPPSRFGYWFHSIDRWLNHLRTWRSLPSGVVLDEGNVRRLAEQLRLQQIWPDPSVLAAQAAAGAAVGEAAVGTVGLESLLARLDELERRVARLEAATQPSELSAHV